MHKFLKSWRFAAVATGMALALPATAADYLVMASKWGVAQDAAVLGAGGTVLWHHDKTGLAAVSSDNPNFLTTLQKNKDIQSVVEDAVFQQEQPEFNAQDEISSATTPQDEWLWPLQWAPRSIEAPAAWAAGHTGKGARVAVVDGGIYDIHPDLSPNVDRACSASFVAGVPWNYDNDVRGLWHATHVAGIVAAADNGGGVIGIAPDATIMGVKVLDNGGGNFNQIIAGVLYASDPASFGRGNCQRADIINLSLGTGALTWRSFMGKANGFMARAMNYAASKGVLVVAAAGNTGWDYQKNADLTTLPCDSGSAICVSATGPVNFALGGTDYRRPARYSNYGIGVIAIAGPGGASPRDGTADACTMTTTSGSTITWPCWAFDEVISTCRGGSTPPAFSYCPAAGTSMATPAVAGVAALIVGANPGISLGALKKKLLQTADDEGVKGYDEFYGHGYVNARRAVSE